jgi:lysophospholipase L1-like esterase
MRMTTRFSRRAAALAAGFGLLLAAPGCGGSSDPEPETKYVALGDSIAFGIGATSQDGYVSLLRDRLEQTEGKVRLDNKAVPLIDTNDLLLQLRDDLPNGVRSGVQNAQILTVSIGGNNLLDCANGDYTSLDLPCMASGVSSFQSEWPQILAEIRTQIGSRARLYVMTIYNPYTAADPNFGVADPYIRQINAVIQDAQLQATYGYEAVDVYTDFLGTLPDGTEKTCAWTHFCDPERNVHPNDAGHAEIARLHQEAYP